MDINALKLVLKNRGFKILILLGIFVLLLQPKVTVKDAVKEDDRPKINYFKDISLGLPVSSNQPPLRINEILSNMRLRSLKDTTDDYVEEKNKEKIMEYNKRLIISECIRIEPKLSKWSELTSLDGNNIPNIDFILTALEQKIGREKLYAEVETGVEYVFQYLKQYKKGE